MAIRLFMENFPGFDFIETPKDQPADIDGFITKGPTIISGVEVKCRNMTAQDLSGKFNNRWLITSDKLDRGIALCRSLGVDFRGFLYLVPDKMLFVVPIWSVKGGMQADIEVERTVTQATVNGGDALRLNAYVDVSKAKVLAEL
jgi:hypothetical protein